jgi:NAD(P)-dependent dehydrogenase (short-subunit alcohol dehydrogenase family)
VGWFEERAGLEGRAAVVIGGAAGVGATVTAALLRAGVHVALADVRADSVDSVLGELGELGPDLTGDVVDAWEPEQLDRFYAGLAGRFDELDVVVNVVGGGVRPRRFDQADSEGWQRDLHRNLGWVLQSTSLALPRLRASGRGGSVVNFTTIEAFRACPDLAVYAAAKTGLTSFTRSLGAELGREHIRVNCIAPDTTPRASSGSTLTPEIVVAAGYDRPELVARAHATYIPQGAPPPADALADAVLFLASNLSSSITGTTLHVDGGTWASAGMLHWPGARGWAPTPPPIAFDDAGAFG